MSQKTRLTLRVIAVIVVLLAVGMQLKFILIPAISAYKFWVAVGGFVLLLITN